jgi:phosphoenolpyruvate-protein phosphotransferase/dihydroxyacetone kinase phosphotransfer subunit
MVEGRVVDMAESADLAVAREDAPAVGIVVVSHSRALARAAVALAGEMLHGRSARIEMAAGLDETTFGTDAVAIKDAIERVDGPAGVVVLMDLGSAVLSAELALDLLSDPATRGRVTLSAAPIVEGLLVAAVAASSGAGREEVAAEARGALMAKAAHLAAPVEDQAAESDEPTAAEVVGVFMVGNEHGLHARPAARLVGEVRRLDATVRLRNLTTGAGPVPGGSLSRVATLGALQGHEVEVRAAGPQAQEAIEHLLGLAQRHFDEPERPASDPATSAAPSGASSTGGPLPGSPGIAIGPLRRLAMAPVDLDVRPVGDSAAEWRHVVESVAQVRRDIEHLRVLTARDVGADEASIFDAHLSLLSDADLLADVKTRIGAGTGAARAWAACVADVEREWAGLADSYLRERAADVRAVGDQVLRVMTGAAAPAAVERGVVVARDLTPAEAAQLDPDLVDGIVLTGGSPTSHAAILARARDIPLVVAAGRELLDVPEGTVLVVDGGAGAVLIDPPADQLAEYRRRADRLAERRAEDLTRSEEPARTRDGARVAVSANVGSTNDARAARGAGADGVGLVRTEFLFLGRESAPELDEQEAEYDAICAALDDRLVTLRTLDVGGDKPLPYLPVAFEQNPFLGLRGIRLSLARRELLHSQLQAICRTARRHPVKVMFPMVSTVGELLEARQTLVDAAGPEGLPAGLRVGVMVEVPAAALKIDSLIPHLDFVSIGTNDLTQYTMAAERGNAAVASLSDALDPAVLQLIDQVCRSCDGRVDVSVCGEVASDELAVPILVGLGVRELSVSPHAVPRVKATVRSLDSDLCRTLAQQALALAGADDVRKLVLSAVSAPEA